MKEKDTIPVVKKIQKVKELLSEIEDIERKIGKRTKTDYDRIYNSWKWYKYHYRGLLRYIDYLFDAIHMEGYDVFNWKTETVHLEKDPSGKECSHCGKYMFREYKIDLNFNEKLIGWNCKKCGNRIKV